MTDAQWIACPESVAMLAVMGLLPWTATVMARSLTFDGRDLLTLSARQRRRIIKSDMHLLGVSRKHWAGLGGVVTDGDDEVKRHVGNLVNVLRAL